MTVMGILAGGEKKSLGEPLELEIKRGGAPADILRASFSADKFWDELEELIILEGQEVMFAGVVDEQSCTAGAQGLRVKLVARSLAAKLLDTEAEPGEINRPSLRYIFEKYLRPLGFEKIRGDMRAKEGKLSIAKGQSVWQVLEEFCSRFLGESPEIDSNGMVDCAEKESVSFFADAAEEVTISYYPCKRLNGVLCQSASGAYDCAIEGETVGKILRQRYIPASAYESGIKRLEKSFEESAEIKLTLTGFFLPAKNCAVRVGSELPVKTKLRLKNSVSRISGDGAKTVITLVRVK